MVKIHQGMRLGFYNIVLVQWSLLEDCVDKCFHWVLDLLDCTDIFFCATEKDSFEEEENFSERTYFVM